MKVIVIALNTFREAVRNKVFYTLLFFAILFAAFSISLSSMIIGDISHIIINMGLANIEIFGTLIAIFVGTNLVHKEFERRTIYTIITRPIRRHQFIIGKYIGLVLTLIVEIAIICGVFFLILATWGESAHLIPGLFPAVWMIFIKLLIVTAVALLFSTISTPILSGMFTLCFYLIASISGFLPMLLDPAEVPVSSTLIRILSFLLPDFRFLDLKGMAVYGDAIPDGFLLGASIYGLLYTVLVLLLSIVIFEKKDMK